MLKPLPAIHELPPLYEYGNSPALRATTFLFGLAVTLAYWPGISGAATTPRWCVIAIVVPALLFMGSGAIRLTAAHAVGALLVAWLCVTALFDPLNGAELAVQLLLLAAAFVFGSSLGDLRPLIAGAAIGIAVSSVVVIAQWLGWDVLPVYAGRGAGLFYNGRQLAEVAAIVFAGALALRMWWALPGLVPALILPLDRTAWLAVAAVLMLWAWRKSYVVASCMLLAIAAGGAALTAMAGLRVVGINERLALWRDTLSGLDWLGHGLGSFADVFPRYAQHFDLAISRPDHPHNEFLWLAFDGGTVAVVLCAALCVCLLLRASDAGCRLVLVALGVECLFAMPLHDPATAVLAVMCCGHLARARRDVRVTDIAGRGPLRSWLAAASV